MELDLIDIISLLIVFVSLLLAVFLLTSRSENYLSNILLAAFLIVNAEDSDSVIIGNFIYPNFPALGMLINSTVLLKIPFLYLYILSVIYSNFRLKWQHLLHAIPFAVVNILFFPVFYSLDFEGKMAYLEANTLSDRQPEVVFDYIVVHIQVVVYLVASFVVVNKYRRLLLENYSNASLFNYKWLFQFLIIISVLFAVASLKNIFMFMANMGAYHYSMVVTSLIALGYIIWLVFRAMRHPELFRGIDSRMQLVKSMLSEENTDDQPMGERPGLNAEVNDKIRLLNNYMTEEEPFLDPSLTIYDLAKNTGLPSKEVSLLINHDLNQHFFDFVNGYRIRKAMDLLKDPGKKEFTVLEILYEVGFNSKSSFNTAFKKYTSTTPTQYRQKHLGSAA